LDDSNSQTLQKKVFGEVPYFFRWYLDFQGLYTSTFKGVRKMVPLQGYQFSIPLGFDLHLFEGPGIWVFPKIGLPQNGWFIKENPIKMDDLGGVFPLFSETPI